MELNTNKQTVKLVDVKAWMLDLNLTAYETYIYAAIHSITEYNGKGWSMIPQDYMNYLELGTTPEDFEKFVAALNTLIDKHLVAVSKKPGTAICNFKSIGTPNGKSADTWKEWNI